ncbi:MAG: thioredoxin domain-containing protein [Candidatus Peregrinibacteria bacterium]
MDRNRKHVLVFLIVCFVALVGGYFFATWLITPSVPPLVPLDTSAFPVQPSGPVVDPTLNSIDDIAKYTNGKPLPSASSPLVFISGGSPSKAGAHIRGRQSAVVSMIEYSSMTNDFAVLLHPMLTDLVQRNDGILNWVYRPYTTLDTDIGFRAMLGGECVARDKGNDAYWKYFDLVMGAQALKDADLAAFAAQAGADAVSFKACLDGNQLYDYIISSTYNAQVDSKIFITPTFIFYNNDTHKLRIVEGANTADYLQKVVEEMQRE